MVGHSGIASASAASAVAQRYRDAASIQAQKVSAKPSEFASALSSEPSVISTIGRAALALPPPAKLVSEAAVPAKPVHRSVLASPALAKRGSAAYGAAAAILQSESSSDSDLSSPSSSSLNIDC